MLLSKHPLLLQLPGVVDFIGVDDIPASGDKLVFGDALFAGDRVDYVGQRLGLIVATSQVAAMLRKPSDGLAMPVLVSSRSQMSFPPFLSLFLGNPHCGAGVI